jgi:hypothetical protein
VKTKGRFVIVTQGVLMKRSYVCPALAKGEKLSAVTAGANFSGKKGKPVLR